MQNFSLREGLRKIVKKLVFEQLGKKPPPSPPPMLAITILKNVNPFFILMDTKHFKIDFSIRTKNVKKNLHFLQSPAIHSLLTVLQESGNLDAIYIICRKIK